MLLCCSQTRPCKLHLCRQCINTPDAREHKRRTINGVVNPIVDGVNFLTKFLGINVDLGPVGRDEVVELGIEHSDYLGTLVIHDRLVLLIPKDGNSEPMESLRDGSRGIGPRQSGQTFQNNLVLP